MGRPRIPGHAISAKGTQERVEIDATHIERVFLCSEHLVLVRNPHTKTFLQSTHDLAQFVNGARVNDSRSGADEPHRGDLVLWLRRVRADKRVIHKPKQCRRVGRHLKVAEQKFRSACRRCISRNVRARDCPREMVKHPRGVRAIVVYARKADLECCVPRIEVFRAHLPSILVTTAHPPTYLLAHTLRGKKAGGLTRTAH